MTVRPRYHANDTSLDVIELEPHLLSITDARTLSDAPRLDREGFTLVEHRSEIGDFTRIAENAERHMREIEALILELSGADAVVVSGPGILRFGEKSDQCGKHNNSRPARFVHVDVSDATAANFVERSRPQNGRSIRRAAHYNVWRCISAPPQDVPLAVCDARSVSPCDLVPADAIFDEHGKELWSFEGLVIRAAASHRWFYYRDMGRDEALVFKTCDSDPVQPHCVPHGAFDDPGCVPDTPPRSSIEMRAIAYWWGQ